MIVIIIITVEARYLRKRHHNMVARLHAGRSDSACQLHGMIPVMPYGQDELQQLACPSGEAGRQMLHHLHSANNAMNNAVLHALDVSVTDQVLEIGFGSGALLALIANNTPLHLAGVEVSEAALAFANQRSRDWTVQPDLRLTTAIALPFNGKRFSAVCASNVIYFWPDQRLALREIRRVLKPKGRVVLAYAAGAPDGVSTYTPSRVNHLLRAAGFVSASSERGADDENGEFWTTAAHRP